MRHGFFDATSAQKRHFMSRLSRVASAALLAAATLACQQPKVTRVPSVASTVHALPPQTAAVTRAKGLSSAVDSNNFVSLTLFLGQALSHRDGAALRAAGFALVDQPCTPMNWRLLPAEQQKLTLDWTLLEFRLDAPNPVAPGTTLDAYLIYSLFVFADGSVRYFMTEYRGSDGVSIGKAPGFPRGFEAQTQHLIDVGFGENCADAQSLSENEVERVLSQGRDALMPFIIERVPLRPVCDSLKYGSPALPRTGWKLREVRLLAQSHGPAGSFGVAAFVIPETQGFQLSAYDPLYFQRSDVDALRACEEAQSNIP